MGWAAGAGEGWVHAWGEGIGDVAIDVYGYGYGYGGGVGVWRMVGRGRKEKDLMVGQISFYVFCCCVVRMDGFVQNRINEFVQRQVWLFQPFLRLSNTTVSTCVGNMRGTCLPLRGRLWKRHVYWMRFFNRSTGNSRQHP